MTLLLAGSVLLIAASAAALVLGWLNANEGFVWASIAATAASAILLITAFFRSRKEAPATATAAPTPETTIDPEILADREERSQQKYQRAMTRGEEEEAAKAESAGDATQVSAPPSDDAQSDDEPSDGDEASSTPAPGSVVTSTSLGAAGAAAGGVPQPDPDATAATAATVGPPAGASASVVAIPKTKKFHNIGCRFASAKGAETMDRSAAVERGFQPCGVCKP